MATLGRTGGALALLVLCAVTAHPQIFTVEGGSSTLLDASGGRLIVTSPYFDSILSVGQTANGNLLYGAAVRKQLGNNTFTVGDTFVPFQLPNDVFSGSSYYSMRGAEVDHVTSRYAMRVGAGLTTAVEGVDFFQVSQKDTPFGSIQLDFKASDKLSLSLRTFFSSLQTAIAGLSYSFNPSTSVALAGGMGANKPYGGISFRRVKRLYEIDAEYIAASLRFSRLFIQTPQFTEPQQGNIRGVYRPFRWLLLNASHMNSSDPYSDVPVLARVDSGSAGFFVWKAHASANFYHSSSSGTTTNGLSFTAGRSITRWLDIDADWFRSESAGYTPSHIGDIRFTERFKQLFTVTEYFTRSNGQNSILLGGSYNGKRLYVSFTNNIVYVPFQKGAQAAGYQRIYAASLSMPLLHHSRVEFNADIDPQGDVRYTAAGGTTFYRYEGLEPGSMPRFDIGKFLVEGKVTDQDGRPVEGAVIRVGKNEAISDRQGQFQLRSSKARTEPLSVPVDDFINSYDYQVVQAPQQVTYVPDKGQIRETSIELRRITTVASGAAAAAPGAQ